MKKIYLLVFIYVSFQPLLAQVGVNTTDPKAQLDIKASSETAPSNTDGILIPRVNAFPSTNPTAAQQAMMIYLTTAVGANLPGFYFWDNTGVPAWKPITGSSGGTLDQAYNFGGAGLGKTITADAGAILINGFDGLVATGTIGSGAIAPFGAGIRMVWNPRKAAFRAGRVIGTEWDDINIGQNSIAFGFNNTSSGTNSTTFGGYNNSRSFGETVFGIGATNYTQTNNGEFQFRTANAIDRLFVVGNAIDADNDNSVDNTERSDALIILKNGLTRLPSTTNAMINAADGKAVVTKEYLQSNTSAWGLTGNAGTNSATNFIGTRDDEDVIFRRLNVRAGLLGLLSASYGVNALNTVSTGVNNNAFGNNALFSNTTGDFNTAIGSTSLFSNTIGHGNTAIGSGSLYSNTTGISNTAIGVSALSSNSTGFSNTATGSSALSFNSTGSHNTANGYHTLKDNTTGGNITAIGFLSLTNNTTGVVNTASGAFALAANTIGSSNSAHGYGALGSNTAGDNNTATGDDALGENTLGDGNSAYGFSALHSNTLGLRNTSNGIFSLFSNSTGNDNTANGAYALQSNTTGVNNTANGALSLYNNTVGINNTASGYEALRINTTGGNNTANGFQTLRANTTGTNNTANGVTALDKNTTGDDNVAMGSRSLTDNVIGNSNTAIGKDALFNSISNNNTAVGRGTLSGVTTGDNNTAIGFDAQVANAAGDNQVRIGNGAVVSARVQVAWTITSDNRWKSNIQKSNLGLEFIKELNPVFYTRKDVEVNKGKTIILETNTNPTTEYGFIAQELESSLNKFNAKDNGIISKDDAGMLGVRYNDLIAPMVKAIQEQQVIIEAQAKIITTILERLQTLENKK